MFVYVYVSNILIVQLVTTFKLFLLCIIYAFMHKKINSV